MSIPLSLLACSFHSYFVHMCETRVDRDFLDLHEVLKKKRLGLFLQFGACVHRDIFLMPTDIQKNDLERKRIDRIENEKIPKKSQKGTNKQI